MNLHSSLKMSVLAGLLVFTSQAFCQTDQTNYGVMTNTASTVKATTPEDDAAILHTLKNLIDSSPILSKLNVHVSSSKGVVKIEGNVDSDTQASSLIEHAESIIGVTDVDTSKLTIKNSQQPVADSIITAKIKGLFIREKLFGEKDIAAINTSVETKDGTVYLSGTVDNQTQINNAIDIIKKYIPEVKKVEYSIKKVTPVNENS